MPFLALFIVVLVCILVAELLIGLIMTILYDPTVNSAISNLDQTYMVYVIAALLITSVVSVFYKRKRSSKIS